MDGDGVSHSWMEPNFDHLRRFIRGVGPILGSPTIVFDDGIDQKLLRKSLDFRWGEHTQQKEKRVDMHPFHVLQAQLCDQTQQFSCSAILLTVPENLNSKNLHCCSSAPNCRGVAYESSTSGEKSVGARLQHYTAGRPRVKPGEIIASWTKRVGAVTDTAQKPKGFSYWSNPSVDLL